ncbi:MAG TPA: signal recognition particle protein [bacterium]|jgi:signal recognition particle subunit SRP54|nr:signal recognition particle protein [bacterium]
MFESLGQRLQDVFRKLAGNARIDEGNVDGALKEVRLALLEADVHYKVVQDLLARVRERALGAEVVRGLAPDQVLAKLVQEELVAMMGGAGPRHLAWASLPPTVILLCGLQGTGKTTTAAKLARRLIADGRKVALVAGDLQRPAAVEQLKVLGKVVGAPVYTAAPGETPAALAARARREALEGGFDALIVDTAGRLAVDEALMAELKAVKAAAQPHEILLVLDAMQGQDALPTATRFHEAVGIDGLVLTKLDGDARGGAALSALAVTGKPVKFLGTGEKTDALEPFHPDRLAGRILGMGDVVGLVERVQSQVDAEQAERLAKKAGKQGLDLQDLLDQFLQLKKIGSLKDLAAMVPGAAKLGAADMDEGRLKRSIAVLQSMTAMERRRPESIHGERRKRIARGSGTRPEDVNQVLRMHEQMRKMMKKMSQGGGRRRGAFGMPGGGGFPGLPGF